VKIWVENQQAKKKHAEQSYGNRQSQEKNNRNNLLPDRTQPNTASYHSCQGGQDRQPRQNVVFMMDDSCSFTSGPALG
jgi:hypothetical protein